MSNRKYLVVLVFLLLFFGVTIIIGINQGAVVPNVLASEISMEATKHDSAGIDLDTTFTFQAGAEVDLDPKYISENITVEPSLAYTVKRNEENLKGAVLVPKETLEPKKVYKFTLNMEGQRPLKWAFQTKEDFKVVSTLPKDKSTGVPVDTGIEINLSHLNFEKLPQYFSIVPEVPGSFEIHKKTAVFVPQKLEAATLYTVTIKKDLPLSGSSETLEHDYVFQFETREEVGQNSNQYIYIYKSDHEFTTQEKPFFQVGYYNSFKKEAPQGEISVYSYKGAEDYITALQEREKVPYWSYLSRLAYKGDTTFLTPVASFSLPLQGYENLSYFEFPEPMPAGYYLAEISLANSVKQIWFQVTDLGIYATFTNKETLLWVHDLSSGLPVKDAVVKLKQGDVKKTNASGFVQLPSPSDISNGVFALINKGNQEGVATIFQRSYGDLEWEKQSNFQNAYWRYLYLDRSLYKPNDKVHFWGVIKPRSNETLPEKLTASLTKWSMGNESVIASNEIDLADFNFSGSMKLPNLLPGYYNLTVKVEGQTLMTQSFDVRNYSKPVYQLEARPERKAMFAGEQVEFQVMATFFEGTAAANIPLNYTIQDKNGQITTDVHGEAHINDSPPYQSGQNSLYGYRYLYLTANLPESGEITGESSVLVLNNDLAIDTQEKILGDSVQIDVEANKLYLEKVNSGQIDPWEKDAFTERVADNHSINVKVYEEVWEKREVGQYYDFINKKVMPRYDYQYKKVPYTEGELTTDKNGKGNYTFSVNDKTAYLVEFSAVDFRGHSVLKEQRVYGSDFYQEYDYPWYHLEKEKASGKYSIGEEVRITYKKNEGIIPQREKGFMFVTSRDGVMVGGIQDTGTYNTVFVEDVVPNFWIKGVYFDGRYYHETPEEIVLYNENDKALDINVTTNQEVYRPGDRVKVNLEIKDKNNSPVEAMVNLNLVDEALYALKDHYADILRSIYANTLNSGIKGTLMTHEPPDPGLGMAEQGGEGGSDRKDFRDNVFFKTLATDKKGKASAEFQVPDNLTSWRLTCQAITEDLKAATKTAKIRVKLPFFVDMIIADTYLTGDEVTVPIRSFGTKLSEGSSVEYEAILKSGVEGGTVITKQTLSGQAFAMTGLQLPSLAKGNYDLTLTGKSIDGLTDTLTYSFRVLDSLATKQQTEFFTLDKKLRLTGQTDSPVTLMFTDYERSQYLDLLWKLTMVSGARIEQKMAPIMGEKLIREYFPDLIQSESQTQIDLLNYQTLEGGISILPYADADLELSVKLASLNPRVFDRTELTQYLMRIVNDPKENRERALIALYGLAALDEPVLQELEIISEYKDLTEKDQLYLYLALIELGDEAKAAEWFKLFLETHVEKLGPNLRVNMGQDQDDILEATSLAAILAVGLNFDEEANKFQAYVLENSSKDILLYLEQLLFLEKALPKLADKPVSFSYTLNNRVENVSLQPQKPFSLILTPDNIADIEFNNIEGQVGVTALYQIPIQVPDNRSTDGVKVTRQYEVKGKQTQEFNFNDLVKVKISYQFGVKAPDGPYELSDFLPAGLKIVERPYYRGVNDNLLGYPVEINGQKAVFLIYDKEAGSFNYYARVVNPGKFRVEQAILQHGKSGIIYSATGKDGVIIR